MEAIKYNYYLDNNYVKITKTIIYIIDQNLIVLQFCGSIRNNIWPECREVDLINLTFSLR